jgi:hypothetical protein
MADIEMLRSFHSAAVAALVDAEAAPASPALTRDVQEFVFEQMARLPLQMRGGVRLVATALMLRSAVGGAFWRQDSPARLRALRRWEASSIPAVSQYVRLIRSLVLLRAHEQPEMLST